MDSQRFDGLVRSISRRGVSVDGNFPPTNVPFLSANITINI